MKRKQEMYECRELSSYKVFLKFVEYDDNKKCNAASILSKECYQTWLISRRKQPKKPMEAFRRALTAHCRGVDGRRPFPEEVEESLLTELRKKQRWACFASVDDNEEELSNPENDQAESLNDSISKESLQKSARTIGDSTEHGLIGVQGFPSRGYHEKRRQQQLMEGCEETDYSNGRDIREIYDRFVAGKNGNTIVDAADVQNDKRLKMNESGDAHGRNHLASVQQNMISLPSAVGALDPIHLMTMNMNIAMLAAGNQFQQASPFCIPNPFIPAMQLSGSPIYNYHLPVLTPQYFGGSINNLSNAVPPRILFNMYRNYFNGNSQSAQISQPGRITKREGSSSKNDLCTCGSGKDAIKENLDDRGQEECPAKCTSTPTSSEHRVHQREASEF